MMMKFHPLEKPPSEDHFIPLLVTLTLYLSLVQNQNHLLQNLFPLLFLLCILLRLASCLSHFKSINVHTPAEIAYPPFYLQPIIITHFRVSNKSNFGFEFSHQASRLFVSIPNLIQAGAMALDMGRIRERLSVCPMRIVNKTREKARKPTTLLLSSFQL